MAAREAEEAQIKARRSAPPRADPAALRVLGAARGSRQLARAGHRGPDPARLAPFRPYGPAVGRPRLRSPGGAGRRRSKRGGALTRRAVQCGGRGRGGGREAEYEAELERTMAEMRQALG